MDITLNGVKHKAGSPKAKMWRKLSEFDENKKDIPMELFADAHADIIAETFANKEVTTEMILDEFAIDDLMPLYRDINNWFFGLIYTKMSKIPNVETVAAE